MHRVEVLHNHDDRLRTLGEPTMMVFAGGTAMHSFSHAVYSKGISAVFCVPVTDDGGSTRRILNAMGGPAIGDLRNLLVCIARCKLGESAVVALLSHRLTKVTREAAREELQSVLDGTHPLAANMCDRYFDVVRSFLNLFVQRAPPTFNYCGGSIGNFVLTGARIFFNSLQGALFVFSRVMRVPRELRVDAIVEVVPREGTTLAVELMNGERIFGQSMISYGFEEVLKASEHVKPLPAPVKAMWYVQGTSASWGPREVPQAFEPTPSTDVIQTLRSKQLRSIVYGRGSFYTSLLASLVVPDVGEAIRDARYATKVLLVNATHDRETCHPHNMAVCELVQALVRAVNRYGAVEPPITVRECVTDVFVCEGGAIDLHPESAGCTMCASLRDGDDGFARVHHLVGIPQHKEDGGSSGSNPNGVMYFDDDAVLDAVSAEIERNWKK
eukprot:PhM_4_TR631/c0_g1_i1/m.96491